MKMVLFAVGKILVLSIAIILAVLFVTTLLLYLVSDYIKPLQKLYCKIGWHCHQKDYIYKESDGCSDHCTCKWCGYEGMVDSQGNLF